MRKERGWGADEGSRDGAVEILIIGSPFEKQ